MSTKVSAPERPHRPPVELVRYGGEMVERPYRDTRTREQVIADLYRELDEWKRIVIANFTKKIKDHAQVLRELIMEQVK